MTAHAPIARPLPCQRALFDLPREIAYLNCAYMSPLMRQVVEAGEEGLRLKMQPWCLSPANFFGEPEEARALCAALVGADAEGVALVPAASYGLATAARNIALKPGRRVVMLKDQFPSNVYPWRAAADAAGAETALVDAGCDDPTAAVLAAIDERCAVAALPHILWTTGARLDLERIGARLRTVGAALVLDLTQSAGAMVTDFARIQPDFAMVAAYKWLLGPYSTGFMWIAPRWREGRPLEETWLGRAGSEDFSRLIDYQNGYQPGARRFDMGQRANFALLPAFIAALRQLAAWTPAAIEASLAAQTRAIAVKAESIGLTPPPEAWRGPHYLSLSLPDGAPADLTARLAAEGVHVSQRGRSLRITPHLYNDAEDADRLIDALAKAL